MTVSGDYFIQARVLKNYIYHKIEQTIALENK